MPDPQTCSDRKRAMRAAMVARLESLDEAARRAASRAACERLLEIEEVCQASVVLFYMAMRTELDPIAAMSACIREDVRIAVPKVDTESGELEAIEVESLDERFFRRDKMGILIPTGGKCLRATEIDAVVVPGLAFDRRGWRLGRGAGYYDRLLVRLTPRCRTIGFAFDCQVVDAVPSDERDRRVAVLVTERTTLECGD